MLCNDSFPHTEARVLSPTKRMFRAEFSSRSCSAPHSEHSHCLTASMSIPVGPDKAPQKLHGRVVFRSLTTATDLPAYSPLYCNIRLSMPQPLSSTDFAIRVFASFRLLTSPTTMYSYRSTISRLNLCKASARRRAALRC